MQNQSYALVAYVSVVQQWVLVHYKYKRKQPKSQVMNATQKQNRKAKAAGGYITLPPITKNRIAEAYYRKAMTEEIERMLTAMLGQIKRAYTVIPVANANYTGKNTLRNLEQVIKTLSRQYGKKLNRNTERIIKEYLRKAGIDAQKSIIKQLRTVYGDKFTVNFNARQYGQTLKITAQRNAMLIKTTVTQVISNVTNVTYDGVTTGQSWTAIEKSLRTQRHIAADRIKRIARDQTAKLNEALNEMAMRDAGVEFFEWSTSRDERVSGEKELKEGKRIPKGSHVLLDGKIYKWGDNAHYPVIDSYGHQGVPGQRVNCRCTARPVILQKDYTAKRTEAGDWIITNGRL